MRISGSNLIDQPVDRVWEALLDPRVLVATIPGCERLETMPSPPDGGPEYAMTVTAGVAAIRGTYTGSCALSDLDPHRSLVMRLSGAGAPGTVDATVTVAFSEPAPGRTEIAYEAEAVVGGMVGGVGQRMLSSVSRRMAGEFFTNVGRAIEAPVAADAAPEVAADLAADGERPPMPTYYRDAAPGPAGGHQEFAKGIAVGAGLVLLGVIAGSVLGRRRR